jgi:hypothetical protein
MQRSRYETIFSGRGFRRQECISRAFSQAPGKPEKMFADHAKTPSQSIEIPSEKKALILAICWRTFSPRQHKMLCWPKVAKPRCTGFEGERPESLL